MSVTLEPVQQEPEPAIEPEPTAEPAAEEPAAEEPGPAAEEPEPAAESVEEPVQPKKRGRPKAAPKAAAPKAAAPKAKATAPKKAVRMKPSGPTMSSSDDDDEPLTRDDMETLLLDYLVKRKTSQQNARRNMWAQLAGLS